MLGDLAEYERHFQEGKRVRVAVPIADGAAFQEWSSVASVASDLLEVELSRDLLPHKAALELGKTLHLGVVEGEEKLCCRGLVVGVAQQRVMLRLIDRLVPYEPREFFRQNVYLPLDYRVPPRQDDEEIAERWRQSRWAIEFAGQTPEPGEAPELKALREELQARLEYRKGAPAVAANISGGGVRLITGERLRPGMLVELTLYLPQPKRVLEIVAEVVQVLPGSEQGSFATALRFRWIDESDRDRLIRHICQEQIAQLSHQNLWQERGATPARKRKKLGPLHLAAALVVLALLMGIQVKLIMDAKARGEKHEIELVFENGILELLRRRH